MKHGLISPLSEKIPQEVLKTFFLSFHLQASGCGCAIISSFPTLTVGNRVLLLCPEKLLPNMFIKSGLNNLAGRDGNFFQAEQAQLVLPSHCRLYLTGPEVLCKMFE